MRSQRGNPVVGQRRKPRPADLLVETLTPSRAPTPSGVPDAACLGAAHQSHSIPHASHSSYGSGHRDGVAVDAANASPAHQDSERGRASGLSSHKSSVHGPPRSRKTPGLRDGLRYVFELHPRGSIDYSHLALTFPQILGSMHTGSAALCIGATLPPDRGSVQSDDVWPLPPPGSFTISAWPKSSRRRERLRRRVAARNLCHYAICALNWPCLGYPTVCPARARVGAPLSSAQLSHLTRLE